MLGGLSLILQQRKLAIRMFVIGAAIACWAGIARNVAPSGPVSHIEAAALAALLALPIGLLFAPKRLARTIAPLGVLILVGWSLGPTIVDTLQTEFEHHWIIALLIFATPFVTAAIVTGAIKGLRARVLARGQWRGAQRALLRILDWLIGGRSTARGPRRHIGDVGPTHRAKRGRGPSSI
jgi:hypothetical protein